MTDFGELTPPTIIMNIIMLVDWTGYFWNQVREQLMTWYVELSSTTVSEMLVTTKLL